jgi:phosphate transport system substrate-binding protein
VQIVGTGAMVRAVREIAESFMREVPGSVVTVAERDSRRSLRAVLTGSTDIGLFTARELLPAGEPGKTVSVTTLGWDAEAVVVNRNNPVDGISRDDLRRIYMGEIRNWQAVGGADQAITVYENLPDSGTAEVWENHVLKGPRFLTPAAKVVDIDRMQAAVIAEPGAIGHVTHAQMHRLVKPLGIDGVTPTTATIQNGSYQPMIELMMATALKPGAATAAFVAYALDSQKGQRILADAGLKGAR